MPAARRDFVSLLLVVLVPIIVNGPMLFGGVASDPALLDGGFSSLLKWNPTRGYSTIDPNIGFISQALGRHVAIELAHGRIQWWNPYEGVGFPIGESLSAAAMFPFSILLGLANGVAIERCVLEIVSGVAMWLLMRELGASAVAAFLAGAAYSLNGTACWLGPPWANTAPFLPLLILGIERLRRGAWGGWALTAFAIGFSILAGFPEIAYLYGLLAVGWAIIRFVQGPRRLWFAIELITSGLAGLFIAAPALIGFADYLSVGFSGGHLGGAFANVSLDRAGVPQVFLPYVWGPIFAAHGILWGNVGGYAGIGTCALALVAAFARPNRALRVLLLVWVIVTIAATFDAPILQYAFVHLPLVKYTAYFRYLPTSWEFALALLAGLAIDDIRAYPLHARRLRVALAIVACGALIAYSMVAGGANLFNPEAAFRIWIFYSLAAAIAVLAGIAVAATLERKDIEAALLAGVIVLEMSGYYVVCERGFPKNGSVLDMAPIRYLQANIGYQRFYTLRPIAPNYGSYYDIASINHNDLPVPNAWIAYIRKNLDPYIDGIDFVGWLPSAGPGVPSRAEVLRTNLHGFERAGVRFVVSLPDDSPFDQTFESPIGPGPQTATELDNATSVRFHVRGSFVPGALNGVEIFQGNYYGTADGVLDVRVCDRRGTCVSGSRPMKESLDNTFFRIAVSPAARLVPPELTVTLTHRSSAHPVAFWTYPAAAGSAERLAVNGKPVAGETVRVRFDFASELLARRTYHDATLSIFELPHPRPYLEAAGCQLTSTDRTDIEAQCAAPSELRRLELLMPGWHALVNGAPAEITPFDDAFQSVRLPAGRSTVRFWFLPPFVEYGFAALLVALIAICASLIFDWRRAARTASPPIRGVVAPSK